MYSEQDKADLSRQLRLFWILYFIILGLLLAGAVVCCVVRVYWPGFVILPLIAFVGFAGWDLWGRTLVSCRRFLQEDGETLSRIFEGRVMELPEEVKTFRGVAFTQVEFRIHDEDTDEPLDVFLYYDREKLPAPFAVGTRMRVRAVDHCIKEILWME